MQILNLYIFMDSMVSITKSILTFTGLILLLVRSKVRMLTGLMSCRYQEDFSPPTSYVPNSVTDANIPSQQSISSAPKSKQHALERQAAYMPELVSDIVVYIYHHAMNRFWDQIIFFLLSWTPLTACVSRGKNRGRKHSFLPVRTSEDKVRLWRRQKEGCECTSDNISQRKTVTV